MSAYAFRVTAESSPQPRTSFHLLVLTGSYAPDRTGIAPLNTELCEYLAARGHHISVATVFPHYPEWRLPREYRSALWRSETRNGVHLYRGPVYVPSRRTSFRRILYDSSVGVSTALRSLSIRRADAILAVSPPLQAALAGCFLSRLKRIPLLVQVKDLVPDLAIALGMLRNPWAIRTARKLEDLVYRMADQVLVIGEGFASSLESKGVPPSKIHHIPDWVDTRFITPSPSSNGFRRLHRIADTDFLALHTGNMGTKQKLDNLLAAASQLRSLSGLRFCLVGDGAERLRLEQRARDLSLPNLHFLPLQPRELLPGMLAAADVLLLSQAAAVTEMVIPSKLLTYLAAGRPVVAAVPSSSEAGRCLQHAGAGLRVDPENPPALAAAVRYLYEHRDRARQLGQAARRYAESHFAADRILPRFESLLASVASPSHPSRGLL